MITLLVCSINLLLGQTNGQINNTDSLFDQFKIKLFKGEKKSVDLHSNPTARRYRTRITETYQEEGLNFAGHYCFVKWGCGSPCKASAIVDLETGKVYDGPDASHGYQYRKNSRAVIVNPTDTTGFFVGEVYEMQIWVWNENSKRFERK